MSKHTPGPWGCTYTSNHAHDYRLTKAGGHSLPVNAEGNDHSEQRANARLIARAPEMADEIARLTAEVDSLKSMVIAQEKLLRSKDAEIERLMSVVERVYQSSAQKHIIELTRAVITQETRDE